MRSVLRDVLSDEFIVFDASDATAALLITRAVQPTVILVDLLLPGGMDGKVFVQRYRKEGGQAKLFLLSTSPGAEQAGTAPGIEVIAKPFDIHKLVERVRAATA